MSHDVDLDAYFSRIGYEGPRAPTLEVLRALHIRHPQAIPFENLDPVLGRPVPLDLRSLQDKLVRGGRGGYCFEQNALFRRVLEQLGFAVEGLSARVLNGRPEQDSPRSHMLLKVDIEGMAYIADVGYGSLTLTAPLRLYETDVQETPHGVFRIVPVGGQFEEQAPDIKEGGDAWRTLYRFSLEPNYPQDYEAPNWYRATHPESPFVKNLMAARALPGRRLGLLNNQFTVRHCDGRVERQILNTPREIMAVLDEAFGIALPGPDSRTEAGLAKVIPQE